MAARRRCPRGVARPAAPRDATELIRFQERHAATGDAAVVGVVFDDSAAAERSFRADEGRSWPMVLDPAGQISVEYWVAGVPESFLVARQRHRGRQDRRRFRDGQLERVLREAAIGRPAGGGR